MIHFYFLFQFVQFLSLILQTEAHNIYSTLKCLFERFHFLFLCLFFFLFHPNPPHPHHLPFFLYRVFSILLFLLFSVFLLFSRFFLFKGDYYLSSFFRGDILYSIFHLIPKFLLIYWLLVWFPTLFIPFG